MSLNSSNTSWYFIFSFLIVFYDLFKCLLVIYLFWSNSIQTIYVFSSFIVLNRMLYQKSEINKIVLIFSEKYLLIAKCHFIYGKILDIYIYTFIYLFYLIDILSSSQYLFISSGVILRIWSKYSMFYTQKNTKKVIYPIIVPCRIRL